MQNYWVYILTLILNALFSIGLLTTFLITFFTADYDKLGTFPEVLCENETVCLFDKSAAYALIEAVIAFLSMTLFVLKLPFCIGKYFFNMHALFHVFFSGGFAVFFFIRLINFGYFDGFWNDQGCKNPAVAGSPFERLSRYGTGPKISEQSQCIFNSYNQEDLIYSTSSTQYKIDWSDYKTYTVTQRPALLEQINGVLGNTSKISIEELPNYFDVYYWGCNNVCLPERYDINLLWIWLSLTGCIAELTVAVLSFYLSGIYKPVEQGTESEKQKLIEAVPISIKVEQKTLPQTPDKTPPSSPISTDDKNGSNSLPSSDGARNEALLKL